MFPSRIFPRIDQLLSELLVLEKSFKVARRLPEALTKAFGVQYLLEDSYRKCGSSVEDALQVLGPDSINRARWLADWMQETEGLEITKVPDIVHFSSYQNLKLMRESWGLIVWFHDAVQRANRKFPEPYLRELELLVIATHDLPEGTI